MIMLHFLKNIYFRPVQIDDRLHAYSKEGENWEHWIRSPGYAKAFKQFFREYHDLPLEGVSEFNEENYLQFMKSAWYNRELRRWTKAHKGESGSMEVLVQWGTQLATVILSWLR
jgi:hypothetical protein